MTIDSIEHSGPVGYHHIELAGQGKAPKIPYDLIPSASQIPSELRMRLSIGAYPLLRLAQARRAYELDLDVLQSQIEHMAVRVDQPGQQGLAAAVNDLRVRVAVVQGCCVADSNNLATIEYQRIEALQPRTHQRVSVYVLDQRGSSASVARADRAESKHCNGGQGRGLTHGFQEKPPV